MGSTHTKERPMVTAAEKKAAEADRKAARERDDDDGKIGSVPETPDPVQDADGDYVTPNTNTISQPVVTPPETFTDSRGVERLSGGFDDGWEPAPVDPDPELVKQNEGRLKALDEAREDRNRKLEAKKTEAEKADEAKDND